MIMKYIDRYITVVLSHLTFILLTQYIIYVIVLYAELIQYTLEPYSTSIIALGQHTRLVGKEGFVIFDVRVVLSLILKVEPFLLDKK